MMLATLVLGAPVVNVSSSVVIQSLPILGPVFATIDETIHSSDALVLKAVADLSGAEDQFARDLFAEHNIARTTPSVYADALALLLPYFRSSTVLDLPGSTDLRMEEGKQAFEEAIDFLREQRPLALVLKAVADLSGAEDQFARDLFAEHNIARTTPSVYADTLAQLLPYFRSATVLDLPGGTDLRMEEGKAAFEEAIDFLREQRPLAPLTTLSKGLTQAAQDHVADSTTGLVSHTGTDGSSPFDRMSRYGTWTGTAGENLMFGGKGGPVTLAKFDFITPARSVMLSLIVDDGVADRGHRVAIYNPRFRVVGIASGAHSEYGTMTAISYAVGYIEGGDSNNDDNGNGGVFSSPC
eukprot:CAMPEP_0185532626 /NCGR_PEP_ID=MMETSP1366-20130426/108039_1 /TAXON_ID=38817 /ORGANISM="Gephyrocapsa oceanica, Strain RCC1303" /LENGTH=353 /DNA_ID=CAMNT_0028144349 /DNA_START=64 /DNA_END=1122 /DNA_ORIENTATION=-